MSSILPEGGEHLTIGWEESVVAAGQLHDAERVLVEGYPMPDMADLPPGDFYRPDVVDGLTKVFVGYAKQVEQILETLTAQDAWTSPERRRSA